MKRSAVLITFLVFVLLLGAGGVVVFSLATSTGVELGGKSLITGGAKAGKPFFGQVGWIRNNSPWPVEVTSIDLNVSDTAHDPTIYLAEHRDDAAAVDGEAPKWAGSAISFPYTLPGGALRYFGFGVEPGSGKIASFDTITVTFKGPLPLSYHTSVSGVQLVASSEDLPGTLIAQDPATDSTSLDKYIELLRAAIKSGDLANIRLVIGQDATEEDAIAFKKSQKGYKTSMPVAVLVE